MRERIESKHVTKEIKSQMPVIPVEIVKERGCTSVSYTHLQGTLRFPCAGCRQLPFCGLAIWGHLALQAVPSRQVS